MENFKTAFIFFITLLINGLVGLSITMENILKSASSVWSLTKKKIFQHLFFRLYIKINGKIYIINET